MGFGLSFGAAGAADALKDVIRQRLAIQALNERQRANMAREAEATREHDLRDAQFKDNQKRLDHAETVRQGTVMGTGRMPAGDVSDKGADALDAAGFGGMVQRNLGVLPSTQTTGTSLGQLVTKKVDGGQNYNHFQGGAQYQQDQQNEQFKKEQADAQRAFLGQQNADKQAAELQRTRETNALHQEIANSNNETRKLIAQNRPQQTVVVQTVDDNGNPVTKIVPKNAGDSYAKPAGATTQNRLDSAKVVNQVGGDIIAKLRDPQVAAQLGPIMGRYNSVQEFLGDPPPELAQLAGEIESYSLANMGVHGMRSAQGAKQIQDLLTRKHTPESLIKTIEGLNNFSQHFVENSGQKVPGAAPKTNAPASTSKRTVYDMNGNPVKQ